MFQLLSFSPCLNKLCLVCNIQVPISINGLSSDSCLCSSRIFKNKKLTIVHQRILVKFCFFQYFKHKYVQAHQPLLAFAQMNCLSNGYPLFLFDCSIISCVNLFVLAWEYYCMTQWKINVRWNLLETLQKIYLKYGAIPYIT